MFIEKRYKRIVSLLFQLIFLGLVIISSCIEFITFFAINGSFTFLEIPFPQASMIEFFISLVFSIVICVISIILIRSNKLNNIIEYFICLTLLFINILEIIYYIPSISFDKAYFIYIFKQFIPIITSIIVIVLAYLQIGEIKYKKYR